MPQQVAAIRNVSKAYKVIKEISSQGLEWGEDYRLYTREALKGFLEGRMRANIDFYLEEMAVRDGGEDRQNGSYSRHLLTDLGDVELEVPRTRRYSAPCYPLSLFRFIRQLSAVPYSDDPHCLILNLIEKAVRFYDHFTKGKFWKLWEESSGIWKFLETRERFF